MKIVSHKGRRIDPSKDVWVYRNLSKRGGPWFSVMQGGRVIGHTRFVTLENVRFVVREAGRQRTIREGRKNVHAFAVGRVIDRFPVDAVLPLEYNPFKGPTFVTWDAWTGGGPVPAKMIGEPRSVTGARSVILQGIKPNLVSPK